MEPTMYCGASSNHVHCEQYHFKIDDQLKLFGNDQIDERTTWLDLRNCTGIIDSKTLTLLGKLEYLNITGCTLEISPKAFACVQTLRSLDIRNSKIAITKTIFEDSVIKNLFIEGMTFAEDDCFINLKNLENLSLENCILKNLNGKLLHNLKSLQYLTIKKCQIDSVDNIHEEIEQLETLIMMENKINVINHKTLLHLNNLKYLALFANETTSKINYKDFQKLPQIETILFETNVYEDLDFRSFPNLKTVQIGTYENSPTAEENELVEKIKNLDLAFEYTFCGTIEVDMTKVQICG